MGVRKNEKHINHLGPSWNTTGHLNDPDNAGLNKSKKRLLDNKA